MKMIYKCEKCGKETKTEKDEKEPECCGSKMTMQPVPHCTTAPHAEMARNENKDEPCDDNRG
jgi:DNA-directed RNA polymerase subunit RPC12/RpoP